MSQCVPSWDLDHDYPNFAPHSTSLSLNPDVPKLDNEVAELTWQNGHLSMHGLGQPRVGSNIWEKTTHDTLEAIVNQSSFFPTAEELVPWFNNHKSVLLSTTTAPVTASVAGVMDALVPCTNNNITEGSCGGVMDSGLGTRVESCSGPTTTTVNKVRAARVIVPEWSSCPGNSVTESANTRQVTVDKELGGGGFTSTSTGSPENTSSGKQGTGDDYYSVCHSRAQRESRVQEEGKKKTNKLSVSNKRSRAAAVHNQSERKRRDKINQRMKTLQKLVPNSSKTDKASMLDEVIEYLKQLQAQVNMMSRMNMMLPYAMQQQQLQMSMMAPMMGMGMGMGMGHVMDINTCRPGLSPSILHPAFVSPWDGASVDHRLHTPMHDPISTFLAASQSQPITMDAYTRMAALYQQLHQNSGSGPKN